MESYRGRVLSFKYAFEGLSAALKEEPNLKFHVLVALAVLILSFVLKISQIDLIIVITLIGLVISVELTNTAIEAIVDSFTEQQHPRAKLAKDVSAAAVFIMAVTAAIVGIVTFLPYLWIF